MTDASGCTGTDEINVTNFGQPSVTISGSSTFCPGGFTTLDAGSFSSYNWTGPISGTDQTLMVDQEGTYIVEVTDANGCIATDEVTVSIQNSLDPIISGNTNFCEGFNTNLDAGIFDSYEWDGPESGTDQTITVSNAGMYFLTVYDASGCSGETSIEVFIDPSPEPVIDGILSICTGGQTSLDAGLYDQYIWSSGNTGGTISATVGAVYSVTVTDVNGCTGESSVTVTEVDNPIVDITGSDQFCPNETTMLDAGIYDSYEWSTGGTNQIEEVGVAGLVTVTVTDATGCTGIGNITLSEYLVDNAIISGSTSYCIGSTTTLDGGAQWSMWQWSTGDIVQTIDVNQEGVYELTVTDSDGCTASSLITVTEETSLSTSIVGSNEICEGETTVLDAGIFDSYNWEGPEGTSTTQTIEVGTAGIYMVTVTDNSGCSGVAEIEIFVDALPEPLITGDLTICEDGISQLSLAENYDDYLWSTGEISPNILISTAGTVSVTVTDIFGCQNSSSVVIDSQALPEPIIAGDDLICPGATTTLDATGNYDSYEWNVAGEINSTIDISVPGVYTVTVTDLNGCQGSSSITVGNTFVENIQIGGSTTYCTGSFTELSAVGTWDDFIWSTGETTQSIQVAMEGLYSVTVTDNNGCTNVAEANIVEDNNLNVNITDTGLTICENGSTTLDAGNSFNTYIWSTGETTQSISVDTEGSYSVTVSDVGGCTGSGEVAIIVNPNPTPNISGDIEICAGSTGILNVDETYNSYEWSTFQQTQSITISAGGTYSVTVIDANGCEGVTSINVIENQIPSPMIIGDQAYCPGETTSLDAGTYENYNWSTGETTQTIDVGMQGLYSVTVTDANGCQSNTSISINPHIVDIANISGSSTFCIGSSTTLDGGSQWTQWDWSTGETTQIIDLALEGIVSITVTDLNGCTANSSITVTEETSLMPQVVGDPAICDGDIGTIDGGPGFASYEWSTGEMTQTISVTDAGTYELTVSDISGCSGTGSWTIIVNSNPTPSISGDIEICTGNVGSIFVDGTYSSYQWSTSENTQAIDIIQGGSYGVTVTDQNGCLGTATINVTENPLANPMIQGNAEYCPGDNTTLDAGVYDNYNWSTGESSQTIDVSTDGIYAVTVTDANGCTGEASLAVNQYSVDNLNIGGSTAFCVGSSTTLDGGSNWAQWNWSTGETTQEIEVSTVGQISVTVTDINGCTANSTVQVLEENSLMITIIGEAEFCNGGSSTLDAGPGFGMYEWSTGESSQTINVSSEGTYSVTVTDSSGDCTGENSIDVSILNNPEPSVSGPTDLCPGEAGTLMVDLTYSSYQWQDGSNLPTLDISQGGIYELTVTDASGCVGSTMYTVDDAPLPTLNILSTNCSADLSTYTISFESDADDISNNIGIPVTDLGNGLFEIADIDTSLAVTISILNTVTDCEDVTTINAPNCACSAIADAGPNMNIFCDQTDVTLGGLTTSMGPNYIIEWTDSAGNFVDNTAQVMVNYSGTFTLSVTDITLDCTVTDMVDVTLTESPEPQIFGPDTFCSDETATLMVDQAYSTIEWSTGENSESIVVDQAGAYGITVTDALGCSGTSVFSVAMVDLPTAQVQTNCTNNFENYEIIITSSASISSTTAGTISELNPGTYLISDIDTSVNVSLVLVDDLSGCENQIDVTAPNCNCAAFADAGIDQNLFCDQPSVVIGGVNTSVGTNISYNWLDELGNSISTDIDATVSTPGIYTLVVYDSDLDCEHSDEVIVTQTDPPSPEIIGVLQICPGDMTTISLAEQYELYEWSTSETTNVIDVDQEGNYSVTVTDILGCTGETSFSILIYDEPSFIVSNIDCSLDLSMYNIMLQTDADVVTANQGSGVIDLGNGNFEILDIDTTFAVTVDLFNSITNCSTTEMVLPPNCNCTAVADAGFGGTINCTETQITIGGQNTSTGSNFSFEWLDEDGNVVGDTPTIDVVDPGIFTLIVTDIAQNCTAMSSVQILDETDEPIAVILSDPSNIIDCQIASITLTIDNQEPDVEYTWYMADDVIVAYSIEVSQEGMVSMIAVDTLTGCFATDSIFVQNNEEYPLIDISEPIDIDCDNQEVLLDGSASQSGTSINYQWYDEAGNALGNDNIQQVTEEGFYVLVSEDSNNGCTNQDTIYVNDVSAYPTIDAGIDLVIPCDETSLTLNANIDNSSSEYEIFWSTNDGNIISGATGVNPQIDTPGTYYFSVLDSQTGCESMDSLEVSFIDNLPFGFDMEVSDPPCFGEENGTININGTNGGEAPYLYTIDDELTSAAGFYPNLGPGTYEIAVVDDNGCVHDTIVEINEGYDVELAVDPRIIELEWGDEIDLNLYTNVLEQNIDTITWSPSLDLSCDNCLNPSLTPDASGNFVVTLIDENGCQDTSFLILRVDKSADIFVPNVFTPDNEGDNDVLFVYVEGNVEIIYEMLIFDRWGELVHTIDEYTPSPNTNLDENGWDGTFNGAPAETGVYVYLLKYKTVWGEDLFLTGDITIVR